MTGAQDSPTDDPERFATAWSRALLPEAPPAEVRALGQRLLPAARGLRDALRAAIPDTAAGPAAGAALVDAGRTEPEAVGRTLECLDSHAACCLGDRDADPAVLRARAVRVGAALASGFAEALRDRTVTEQRAVARAALGAQAQLNEGATQALHESEARFRAVFEGAATGIWIAGPDSTILQVNGAMTRMFGGNAAALLGRSLTELTHAEDGAQIWRLHDELVRGAREHYRVEKAFTRPDGTVLWTNLTVSLLRDADGRPQYQLALMEDTTERRLLNLRLRYEATHDALTGLPNRTLFFERLEKAVAAGGGQRFGLCYLDLDGFKTVNDSLGHQAGDRLLVEVADRLQACATGPGEMVARLGGDEFVALTTGAGAERGVDELAERIMNALATPVRIDGRELTVRGSVGIVEGAAGERGAAEVLRSADITMYRAKSAGGNRFEFADPEADARAISRHRLTNALPAALDNGEFFIEYQPLVRLEDGSVGGAEALVRWLHPQQGVVGPDRFIPLAERTGLIVPLGRWVLEQAVRQATEWEGATRVNVNLSPCQLTDPGLVRDTARILEDAGLPPQALCLEITETALVGAEDEVLRPLRTLCEMGVDIALDDFGTGYSNLAGLRRLPVSELKLDRSFTRGIRTSPADPVDVKIVEGVVRLARTLGLSVTVEGVETAAQAERLRKLGCDTAQGWYYARPGPPERLHQLALADAC
ncbi:putative bifunctional diguanylate cyclase/phosphodiesterase [Streptomyces fragilis]|uniref:EAL domain-containing protein n=1 Tax=Streptomyces fragilis TaxID=67301 RepID=A0ABV2YQI7_9ACTN|nr:EAL domain-containing protein [Streptomyces fragilis]